MSGGNVVNLYALREFSFSLLDAIDKYEDATYSNLEGEVIPEHFREVEWELGKAKVALNVVSVYARCVDELVRGELGEEVFLEKLRGQIGL